MNTVTKNKIFDLVLAEALEECLDKELKEFDEIKLDEPHEFSKEFEKKMRKIINSIGKKDRVKKYVSFGRKAIVTAAAVLGIIFGGLLTQPEVYASVQNVIRNVFDKYDKYEYVGESLTVDNFDDSFRLGYVPDGYSLSNGAYSPVYVVLTYTNENEIIEFSYGIADGLTASYDNEHNFFDTFTAGEIEYYYYNSNDENFYSSLVWYDGGYSFGLNAHLSKDELVKIAENIEKWIIMTYYLFSERFLL